MTTRCTVFNSLEDYPDQSQDVNVGDFFYAKHPDTKNRRLLIATEITSVTVTPTGDVPWTRIVGCPDRHRENVVLIAVAVEDGHVWSLTENEPVAIVRNVEIYTTSR